VKKERDGKGKATEFQLGYDISGRGPDRLKVVVTGPASYEKE